MHYVKILGGMAYCVYFFSYVCSKLWLSERTQKGEEINIKIEGLKHYIEEYTSLDEKEQSELVLWEEYLVYSVLFGYNKKLIKEMSKVIEIKEYYKDYR